jgi:hypothetical protein
MVPWRNSLLTQRAAHLWSGRRNAIRFRLAGEDLHVAFVNPSIGMFAQMNFCLYMGRYVERSGQRLHITLKSGNYLDPAYCPNWFEYFFFHRHGCSPPPGQQPIEIWSPVQIPIGPFGLTLADAHRIFFAQFGIRAEIAKVADSFAHKNGVGQHTIGVHYRGTDKHFEAVPVDIPDALAKIRAVICCSSDARNLFVASDDARFVRFLQDQIYELPIVTFEDSVRSEGDAPIHLGKQRIGNYAMGRDAVLNALLLSRCGSLVRTTSFLSGWASIFNPLLPVSLINVPRPGRLWFPETLIVPAARLL